MCAFLRDRRQRVKIGDVLSDWLQLMAGMPQGFCLSPLTFVILIDALRPGCLTRKYVDDTMMSEILDKSAVSSVQSFVDELCFYKTVVRPVLEYACPAWHSSLTTGQSKALEAIQRRAMVIIFVHSDYEMETKLSILKTCVFSTMLYGCETWTVTKRCESRILSFDRKCYRKILRIGWTQKVTNEELYRKIQLTETLLQKVIQRKLHLFGHICRMNDSRKIKTLVFGGMAG